MNEITLQFPPKEYFNSRVSLESLYGTWLVLSEHNALIQFPKAKRERLIFAPSKRRSPLFLVTEALYYCE
jgi:hypothetical protein